MAFKGIFGRKGVHQKEQAGADALNSLLNSIPDHNPQPEKSIYDKFVKEGTQKTGAVIGSGAGAFVGARAGPTGARVGSFLGGVLGNWKAKRFAKTIANASNPEPNSGGGSMPSAGDAFGGASKILGSGFSIIKKILFFLFMIAGVPILGALAIFKGVMPINAWPTWIFVFMLIGFAIFAVQRKWPWAGLMVMFMLVTAFFAGNLPALGIDIDQPNVASLVFSSAKGISCWFEEAKQGFSPEADLSPKCQDTVTDNQKNTQEIKQDIVISSFTSQRKVIKQGEFGSIQLKIDNKGKNSVNSAILIEHPEYVQLTGVDTEGCSADMKTCLVTIDTGVTPIIWDFNVLNTAPTEDFKFNVYVKYNSTLNSTLILEVASISERELCRASTTVPSVSDPGTANLILYADNQPLCSGKKFNLEMKLVNNKKDVGTISKADVLVAVPKDIVTSSITCQYGVNNQRPTTGSSGNYHTIHATYDDKIEDQVSFFCSLNAVNNVDSPLLSKSVIGTLNYEYVLGGPSPEFEVISANPPA